MERFDNGTGNTGSVIDAHQCDVAWARCNVVVLVAGLQDGQLERKDKMAVGKWFPVVNIIYQADNGDEIEISDTGSHVMIIDKLEGTIASIQLPDDLRLCRHITDGQLRQSS